MNTGKRTVTVLGSTGSIGESTLDVLAQHPQRFAVYALTASTSVQKLSEQCLRFSPLFAVMACERSAAELAVKLKAAGSETRVLAGEEGLAEVAAASEEQSQGIEQLRRSTNG